MNKYVSTQELRAMVTMDQKRGGSDSHGYRFFLMIGSEGLPSDRIYVKGAGPDRDTLLDILNAVDPGDD